MKPALKQYENATSFEQFLQECFEKKTGNMLWHYEGAKKEPHVTVLGVTHGDEIMGVELIRQLIIRAEIEKVRQGILTVGIANPEAFLAKPKVRYLEKDLNRCFGNNSSVLHEEKRANQLKPLLTQTDVLFDIHSTIKPSHPFLTVPNLTHPYSCIIPALGIETIVTGKGLLPPSLEPIYTDTFVANQGGLGITIEAGWIQDPQIAKIINGVLAALKKLGIFELKPEDIISEVKTKIWDAYWNVIAGKKFQWTNEWGNFDVLEAGTHFATSDGENLVTQEKSIILFPKPPEKIITGQEVCIIARALNNNI